MAAPSRRVREELRSSTALVVFGVLSAGFLLSGEYAAQAQQWDGDVSSDWTVSGNWNGPVPGMFSNVEIDGDGKDYQPIILDSERIRSLNMKSGTLSITGAAASLEVRGSSPGGGIVNVTGGRISISGGASLSADRGVNVYSGGTINIGVDSKAEADITSYGTITNAGTVTGTLEVNGGTVTNFATGVLQGAATVNGGALSNLNLLDNTLTINDGGTVYNAGTVTGVTTVNDDGILNNNAGGHLNGGLINYGTSVNAADGTVASVINNDGTFTNSGTVTGAATVNGGALSNLNLLDNTLTINNGGTVYNAGTVTGVTTVNAGGILNNNAGGHLNGGLINYGTSVNAADGTVASVVNNDGTFTNSGTVTGAATVNGGALSNLNLLDNTLTINDGGTVYNAGTVTGVTTVNADGILNNNAGGHLNGGLINYGTSVNAANGTVASVVNNDGTFTNSGTVTGAATVNGGALSNLNLLDNTLTINNGGTVYNAGTVTGVTTVNADGILNNNAGGHLNGELINYGTSVNAADGTVASVINNDGTFTNSGTVTGAATVNGGTLSNLNLLDNTLTINNGGTVYNAGTVTGVTTVNAGGILNNNAGGHLNGGLINYGTSVNAVKGTVANIANNAGTFTNLGAVLGAATINAGTVYNTGTVTGVTTVNTDGILNNNAGGHLNGGLINYGTSVNAVKGTVANIANNAGTFTNLGAVLGAATINGGTVYNAGTVTGVTTVNAGGILNNNAGGHLNGGLVNYGVSVNAAEGFIANVVNNAGTFTNSGTVATATVNGGTLSNLNLISGALTVNNGGAATNAGKVSGLATVNTGGTLNNAGGQFDGGLVNSGTVTGAVTATRSTITNQATGRMLDSVTVNGGEFVNFGTVEADVRNLAGVIQNSGTIAGTFANSDRAYVQGSVKGDISNKSGASFNLTGNLQASSGFVNEGTFASGGYNTIGGLQLFTNSSGGKLAIRDGLTIASVQTRFEQGSVIDMVGNGTGDSLTVNGNLQSQGATYNIDLYGTDKTVTADKIVVNGNLTGTGNLNFTVGGDLANGQRVLTSSPVTIFDVSGTNDSQFTVTGLPFEPGIIEYEMFKDGQDWVVSSGVNPNAGAIAGSLALINSMVGTVVNRPNSAFVGGLAYEAKPNECGVGPWSRGTGGSASISGTTTGGLEDQVSEVDAYYGGYQGGADFQCFNIGSSGWDVAVGGFGGFNMGRSKQAIDETSVTADFNQYYGGVYASAAKGQFVAELQTRFDYLDYTLNSPVLGLRDAGIDATRLSASGTASYAFTFGDYSLVPSAGASVSYLRTDDLVFRSRHSLSFENQWSVVGFGGVTLARSFLNADKTAAYRPFVTATVYSDFGAKADSTFYDPVSQVTQDLSSEGVGTFGEVSVGLDYLKILPESSFLKARQLNATVRGDLKFSDRLLSGGATVQLRLQF